MRVNPQYEEAEKKNLPTDGIDRFLLPLKDPKTGEIQFPQIIYAQARVKIQLENHNLPRSKKLPLYNEIEAYAQR